MAQKNQKRMKPAKATLDACEALWAALSVTEGKDPAALRARGWRAPALECASATSAAAQRMHRACTEAGFERKAFDVHHGGRLRRVTFYRPKA